jgi:hypothetical protein
MCTEKPARSKLKRINEAVVALFSATRTLGVSGVVIAGGDIRGIIVTTTY